MAFQAAIGILDTDVSFKQSADLERSEGNIPDPIVDFLQTGVFALLRAFCRTR